MSANALRGCGGSFLGELVHYRHARDLLSGRATATPATVAPAVEAAVDSPHRHARDLLSGRAHCHSGDSRSPESLICCFLARPIKDSGFRVGEEYSRYASLFLYHTE